MFGIFASQLQKTRRLAADWLELADKVFNYRRDVLSESDLAALQAAAGDVRRLVREKADTARLKLGIDGLEAVLRRTGGSHYPKSGLVENVEFFLVAAMVILGLRAFYVQPFKIPTNSMWPSYFGMTGQVYANREDEPSALRRIFDLAAVGASSRRVDAPVDGEVLLPLGGGRGIIAYQEVAGRSWLVIPTRLRQYRLFVGERSVDVQVPLDFDMDWVLRDTFFPGDTRSLSEIVNAKRESGELMAAQVNTPSGPQRAYFLRTGKMLKAGDRVMSFDILTGDQLFVDRLSYHFIRPQVGQGFVFRTDHIKSRYLVDANGKPVESYYIKRLVGVPGDTLRIADYTLYRNGAPITGAPAFAKNARRADRFVGYRQEGLFKDGAEVVIAPGQYLPLGDNSANSLDGRYWGTVAAADVVGRPLFIYYPFTNRWGVAP